MELGLSLELSDYSMDYCFTIARHEDHGFIIHRESFLVSYLNEAPIDLTIENGEPSSNKLSLTPSRLYDEQDKDYLTNNYILSSLYNFLHFDKQDRQKEQKSRIQRCLKLL